MSPAAAILALGLLLACAAPVRAHEGDESVGLDFRHAPRETLAWGTLAKVGLKRVDGGLERTFLPPVRALGGRRVTLYGYVTPVGEGAGPERTFLLSSRRIVCKGCAAPVEPEGIAEVTLRQPADLKKLVARSEAWAVRGVLELVEDRGSVLYRVKDAALMGSEAEARRRSMSRKS